MDGAVYFHMEPEQIWYQSWETITSPYNTELYIGSSISSPEIPQTLTTTHSAPRFPAKFRLPKNLVNTAAPSVCHIDHDNTPFRGFLYPTAHPKHITGVNTMAHTAIDLVYSPPIIKLTYSPPADINNQPQIEFL